jgi:hypothetical protein
MNEARRQQYARVVVLVGIMYALIGVVFTWPAHHVRMWRLAAWLVSAAAEAQSLCRHLQDADLCGHVEIIVWSRSSTTRRDTRPSTNGTP